MFGSRRRSLPTIDISPSDSDVEIVPVPKPGPIPGKSDGPSMAAFLLTKPTAERKLWSSESQAGEVEVDVDLADGLPAPRRRARSMLSKLIFLGIISVVLTLVACEVSIAFKVPWLDPRPTLVTLQRAAMGKLAKLRGR